MGYKMSGRNILLLFDVDGTLTGHRQVITAEMEAFMEELKSKFTVGLVGGSNFEKISEQMKGDKVLEGYDYVFAENGLVAFQKGSLVAKQDILQFMGEDKLQMFINYCLNYMSELTLPAKRGTFIEFRSGMINICPVGRSCNMEERLDFAKFDQENHVREKFVQALRSHFPDLGLHFSLGGQISIDAFPTGWDKRFCLQYLEGFKEIHFFGDKTYPGGNDHEIYEDPRTVGHRVVNPEDTRKQVQQLIKSL